MKTYTLLIVSLLITQIFSLCPAGQCLNENCCICREIPNQSNGNGFLEYNQDCLTPLLGGLHCISNTGCQLCYKPTFGALNVGQRPVCARFGALAATAKCTDLQCCLNEQNPNPTNGVGYYDFDQQCYDNGGGLHCVADTGCKLCYKPVLGGFNLGSRPVCQRFLQLDPLPFISPPNCSNQTCCIDAQSANEDDGNGFYEFDQGCYDNGGGLHCVGASGCRLCYKPVVGGSNIGGRPICLRFLNLLQTCPGESCCIDMQNPNLLDGNGFLEFNQACLDNGGGLDCVHTTGCRYCYKPVIGGINVGQRPICTRFLP